MTKRKAPSDASAGAAAATGAALDATVEVGPNAGVAEGKGTAHDPPTGVFAGEDSFGPKHAELRKPRKPGRRRGSPNKVRAQLVAEVRAKPGPAGDRGAGCALGQASSVGQADGVE